MDPGTVPRVLIVEDDLALASIMREILGKEGFKTKYVPSIVAAIDELQSCVPDLIIADMRLADGSGLDFVEYVRQQEAGSAIPIIMVSAVADKEAIARARLKGVDEYFIKPFDPMELVSAVRNHIQRQKAVERLATREAHLQTVLMLANAIEARSPYTRGHSERVRHYALMLGKALGWSEEKLTFLEFGALLHDIGKIKIPTAILEKPGALTPEERALIQSHPLEGAKILRGVEHLKPAVPYVLYHHERCDGSGYPFRLTCDQIPPEGRLTAIADSYDAMVSRRPYRAPIPKEAALSELAKQAGVLYDAEMVKAFVEIMKSHKARPVVGGR